MRKSFFLALIVILVMLGLYFISEKGYFSSNIFRKVQYWKSDIVAATNKEATVVWLNVFVHGTVGVSLAFLDFAAVQSDTLENSLYKKTVSVMRKDKCFYQDQPIADKGLHRIEPSFEFVKKDDYYYAAYPVLQAFEEVSSLVNSSGQKPQNIYYLFGWSGVLSQKRRRCEALRLYNQLVSEVEIFKKLGFIPKIRILTHSHGGNLCLNLAGFHHCLNNSAESEKFYCKFTISSYIKELFERTLATSFDKEVAFTKKGQKRFDYCPENSNLFVDELIMLGTPIQEETSLFIESSFFGKVYNIYSEADVIQSMDYVTTAKKQSFQRIDDHEFGDGKYYQVSIKVKPLGGKENAVVVKQPIKQAPFWQVLLGLRDTSRKSSHPTHKELWFVVPPDKTPNNFLRPLPIVCFYPIIKKLQEQESCCRDFDFEVDKENNNYTFTLKDKDNHVATLSYDSNIFEDLKEQAKPWIMPRDNSKIMRNIMNKFIEMKSS